VKRNDQIHHHEDQIGVPALSFLPQNPVCHTMIFSPHALAPPFRIAEIVPSARREHDAYHEAQEQESNIGQSG
jgi:hypothetical protein